MKNLIKKEYLVNRETLKREDYFPFDLNILSSINGIDLDSVDKILTEEKEDGTLVSFKVQLKSVKDSYREFKESAELMFSSDYKEQFIAEYYQIKYRVEKLEKLIDDWNNDKLKFTPTTPKEVLMIQLGVMQKYLLILTLRAENENIDLDA